VTTGASHPIATGSHESSTPGFLLTPQFTVDRAIVAARPKIRKQALRELAKVVAEIRQEAEEKGIDKVPMSEIRAAVTAMRRDLKKGGKRPAK